MEDIADRSAISEQGIDLVRALFDASARDDLAAYLALVTQDAEFDFSVVDRPYSGVYRGHEQIEKLYRRLDDPWRKKEFELENPVALPDGIIVDVARTARTVAGLRLESRATAIFRIQNRKLAAVKVFESRSQALKAAHLR